MAITLNPVDTIPNQFSSGSEWIGWHKALRKRYGRATANQLWLEAWNKRGCVSTLAYDCKANTSELRDYLAGEKISIDRGVYEYVADTVDDIESFASTAFNVGLAVYAIIILFIVGLVGMLLWNIVSNKELVGRAASAATTAATRGLV